MLVRTETCCLTYYPFTFLFLSFKLFSLFLQIVLRHFGKYFRNEKVLRYILAIRETNLNNCCRICQTLFCPTLNSDSSLEKVKAVRALPAGWQRLQCLPKALTAFRNSVQLRVWKIILRSAGKSQWLSLLIDSRKTSPGLFWGPECSAGYREHTAIVPSG